MRSITVKLIFSFLIIGLISIGIIVILAWQSTRNEFNRFVAVGRGESLVSQPANYYTIKGSWDGVHEIFAPGAFPAAGNTRPYPSFTIADENGYALFEGGGFHIGESIPEPVIDSGIPISADGQTVGVLVMDQTPFPGTPHEQEFIRRTDHLLLYGAIGASIVALLLGIFLSRTISRPIRELTLATHAVSEGDLNQQVPVRSNDEIGQLSYAFNNMSAKLSRSVNARRQMTADIAHELRTPLSLILGHAEAVHDGVLPASRENFEIVREEATRLEHLVDDLRTLSLADAGELTIQPQTISPTRLLGEVASLYRLHAQSKNLTFHLDIMPSLSDIELDPGRITQVLTNILDNAMHHAPEGGIVTLRAYSTPDSVEFRVHDSGPGLPPEYLERIFDRFYRADESRRRDQGGSGLGLAIAKSIVQAHGGTIRAENAPEHGLTVIITFPLKIEGKAKL